MLVPKLRFKEFKDDWIKNKLGEIGVFKNGISKSEKYFGHGYKFVNLQDIFGKNEIKNGDYQLVEVSPKELDEYKLNIGDVLFVRSSVKPSGVGLTSVVTEKMIDTVYSGFIIRFREIYNILNLNFKKYCFYTDNFRKEVLKRSSSSANTNINQDNLSVLPIYYPSKIEQEKIANFLSLLDKKIELQNQKIEALKIYKRGLIQKIYQTNYNNKIKMKEILIQKSIRNTNDKKYNVYSVSNKDGFILQTEQFKERMVASEDTRNYKVVEKDDFAYNPARINVGSIARMKQDIKGIISPMYICFKCNEKIIPEYLEYFFESSKFTYEMNKRLEGSVRMCLSYESMLNIPIELPNKNEQEKISEILKSLSQKIKKEEKKYMELNMLKKGLLQKMLSLTVN